MTGLSNERAEEAVIASLLVDPAQIALIADKLQPNDFAVGVYRDAYREMLRMSRAGIVIDQITLAATGVELPDTLDILSATRGGGVEAHVQLVRDAAFRRTVFTHAQRVSQQADAGGDPTDLLRQLQELSQLASHGADDTLVDASRAVDLYVEEMSRRRTQGVGLAYGIRALDAVLQPAHGGDMVVIAARPSIGKTALAETIIDHWARTSRLPVLFISVEMSLAQLLDRAVSREASIPSSAIVRGDLTADQEVLARETIERRRSVNIWYEDNPYATTATVRAAASRVALEAGGVGAIAIDYLQLLKDAGDQETQRITKVSRNVKAIAREFRCPMLVLSQLNRQAEYRDDPHPRLADIRESGAVEQDADVVLGLYRDRSIEADFVDSDMDIDILKNRQGPSGIRIVIPFHGEYVRFDR